jgi:hypothetical protein
LWNHEKQIETVRLLVNEAIEQHGYNLSLDLNIIVIEWFEIDNDVQEWTKDEKPVEYINHKKYENSDTTRYKILRLGSYNFIDEDDFDKLSDVKYIECYIYQYYERNNSRNEYWLKRSGDKNKIFVSGEENPSEEEEYEIECEIETRNEEFPYLKPAHPDTIKAWDKRIKVVLNQTGNLKSQIESHKTKDLKNIYENIFVDRSLTIYVENNLNSSLKQIEQMEIEANRIQFAYTNIKPSQAQEPKEPLLINQ